MYNQTGGGISKRTFQKMEQGGASSDEVDFARRTMNSVDRDDVAIHR